MKEKMLEYLMIVFIAGFVTVFAILVSHSAMVNEVTPVPMLAIIFTMIYLITWVVLVGIAVKRYYAVLLLLFGLFWLSSFVILIFLMLSVLLSNDPLGFVLSMRSVFYAPLYGLQQFFPAALAQGIGAGISIILGLTSMLCVPRRANTLSRKEYKKMR